MEPACHTCGTHLRRIDGVCPACVARSITGMLSRPVVEAEGMMQVPGYEMMEVIGRGGMGVVFRALRASDGSVVAVKLLPAHLADQEEITDRFVREAHALAAFDHPHVLRVLDSGMTPGGQLFLVTEHAAGGDLAHRLQQGTLSLDEAVELFHQVLEAIGEAHHHRIVHRDIKPANILLDDAGRVRVGDFALAKLLREGGVPQLTLTQGGDVFGTPYYIAPELRLGAGAVDERADLFSLGVLLHEMLTGRVPIGSYEPASSVTGVPRAMDRLIARCLREDPAKRPQSVEELRGEFDAALKTNLRSKVWMTLIVLALLGAGLAVSRQTQITPLTASKLAPWSNSMGMNFVPVPGTKVLFSIWETRRCDFAKFAKENPGLESEHEWERAAGAATVLHPVSAVSWLRAEQFCKWLTKREHDAGMLPRHMQYRLPTDLEWSAAAGLPSESGGTPQERNAQLGPMEHAPYPWGRSWPPPAANFPANFAGQEAAGTVPAFVRPLLAERDEWPTTAPVGAFPANDLGLYDLSGNVSEWCLDAWSKELPDKTTRGGAWNQTSAYALRLDGRGHASPPRQPSGTGFRVVVQLE